MNAQTCSMPVPLTGAGALRGALKPYVPPDLAWCHPPHWQQVFTPSLDCKEHPTGDCAFCCDTGVQGHLDSLGSWTQHHHSAPRCGQRQSPRGQQGHESRGLASVVLGDLSHIQAEEWVCR